MKKWPGFVLVGAGLLFLGYVGKKYMDMWGRFKIYREYADKWLTEYEIPVEIWPTVYGLIEQESSWDPRAFREEPAINDRSRGLMQILEGTARDVGFTGDPDDLFDPDVNCRWGLKFFLAKLKQYGWQIEDAIEAYNAGHAKAPGAFPTQTTDYARAVEAHAKHYTV